MNMREPVERPTGIDIVSRLKLVGRDGLRGLVEGTEPGHRSLRERRGIFRDLAKGSFELFEVVL
jgi:hypothetical protein